MTKTSLTGLKQHFILGIGLTLLIACFSVALSYMPYLSIIGPMLIAIFLGIFISALLPIPQTLQPGIDFSAKKLLRFGIILMGLRLNLLDITAEGFSIITIDILAIFIALASMHFLSKWLRVDEKLAFLITVGTAICGAAAIIAAAVIIQAKKQQIALSVAIIGILGTLGALGYIVLQSSLPLDSHSLGVLAGATLHEIAHVVAVGSVLPTDGADAALVVKLGRVILLVPVLLLFSYYFSKKQQGHTNAVKIPFPFFVLGFLGMSLVNTFDILPQVIIDFLIQVSIWLLVMSMAGLGLGVKLKDFKEAGPRPIFLGILGFIVMLLLTPVYLWLLTQF